MRWGRRRFRDPLDEMLRRPDIPWWFRVLVILEALFALGYVVALVRRIFFT